MCGLNTQTACNSLFCLVRHPVYLNARAWVGVAVWDDGLAYSGLKKTGPTAWNSNVLVVSQPFSVVDQLQKMSHVLCWSTFG